MRYEINENTWIIGSFTSGSTITIKLYDLSDDSVVTLSSTSCAEIGTTGIFKWNSSNISSRPSIKTEYLWEMTDGAAVQYGKFVLGGYPDVIISDTGDLKDSVAGVGSSSDITEKLLRNLTLRGKTR